MTDADLVEAVLAYREAREDVGVGDRDRRMPAWIELPFRNRWPSPRDAAIPKSTVVGTNVSHRIQRQQPGFEHSLGNPKLLCNFALDLPG